MKRTYVDILGEYYDGQDELLDEAGRFGITESALIKAYKVKRPVRKFRSPES